MSNSWIIYGNSCYLKYNINYRELTTNYATNEFMSNLWIIHG